MGCRLGIRSDGWCGWVAAQPDEAVFGGPPYGLCRLLVCPAGEQACDVVPVNARWRRTRSWEYAREGESRWSAAFVNVIVMTCTV